MEYRIHPSARRRLVEIWDYTEETWGAEQADRYVEGLFAELDLIAQNRRRWRPVGEEGFEGVFFAKYRHHFIFFRDLGSELGVVTVLHESMDLPNRLREDAEDSGVTD